MGYCLPASVVLTPPVPDALWLHGRSLHMVAACATHAEALGDTSLTADEDVPCWLAVQVCTGWAPVAGSQQIPMPQIEGCMTALGTVDRLHAQHVQRPSGGCKTCQVQAS